MSKKQPYVEILGNIVASFPEEAHCRHETPKCQRCGGTGTIRRPEVRDLLTLFGVGRKAIRRTPPKTRSQRAAWILARYYAGDTDLEHTALFRAIAELSHDPYLKLWDTAAVCVALRTTGTVSETLREEGSLFGAVSPEVLKDVLATTEEATEVVNG